MLHVHHNQHPILPVFLKTDWHDQEKVRLFVNEAQKSSATSAFVSFTDDFNDDDTAKASLAELQQKVTKLIADVMHGEYDLFNDLFKKMNMEVKLLKEKKNVSYKIVPVIDNLEALLLFDVLQLLDRQELCVCAVCQNPIFLSDFDKPKRQGAKRGRAYRMKPLPVYHPECCEEKERKRKR